MVLSGCPTCLHIVISQVTQQLLAGKVVKKYMVVSALQVLCEVFDYSLTQLLLATSLLACVHLELVKVSIVAVSKGPPLDTGFMGMNCFRVERPVNLIMASLTDTSLCGSQRSEKRDERWSITGRTFPSRSYPEDPLGLSGIVYEMQIA